MVKFKYVLCDVSSNDEWLYMLDDELGTVVSSWELIVEDDEDEKAARSFGWSEEEIRNIDVRTIYGDK
jgi:hypothetical protein